MKNFLFIILFLFSSAVFATTRWINPGEKWGVTVVGPSTGGWYLKISSGSVTVTGATWVPEHGWYASYGGDYVILENTSTTSGAGLDFSLDSVSLTWQLLSSEEDKIPKITSGGHAGGTVGKFFTYQTRATNSPTSFACSGALPVGLSFNRSTGLISGIPANTSEGNQIVYLTASNADGTSDPRSLLIVIDIDENNDGEQNSSDTDAADDEDAANRKTVIVDRFNSTAVGQLKSAVSSGVKEAIGEDITAIKTTTQGIYDKMDELISAMQNINVNVDTSGIEDKLETQIGIQNEMKDLLQAIKDKMYEEEEEDPYTNPENKSLGASSKAFPEIEMPELEEPEIDKNITFNWDIFRNMLRQRDGGDPMIIIIPLHLLNSALEDWIVNFSIPPLSGWVSLFRGAASVSLYLVTAFCFIRIIKTFEF